LLASLAAIPSLAACASAWPTRQEAASRDARPATLPYRSSGRTAATAHLDVREPMPFQHEDSPLGTTMEGPPITWSPGWNSVQAVQKHPIEATDAPGIFIFADAPGPNFEMPASNSPDPRILGAEELSDLAPAIIARREALP
jgi:hypothetical protein